MSTTPTKNARPKKEPASDRDVVRFNLYLPRDAYEALEELQSTSGKRSMAETIRAALRLYEIVHQGVGEGKDVFLMDRKSKEKERLVSL
jgi:hypothetical protein